MRHLPINSLLVCVLLVSGLAAFAQEDDACFAHRGFWNDETQQCLIQSELSIDIVYPLSLAAYPFADQIIDSFIQDHQNEFLMYFAEGAMSYSTIPIPWTLDMRYSEHQFSDHVVSFEFVIYEYTGGAHGNTYFQTFTFDLAQQRQISLDELFNDQAIPFDIISPIAQQQINETLGDFTDVSWVADGTGDNPDNYRNFVLTEDTLVFLFPPYQVAPYAAGPQTVMIPLTQLENVIAPAFRRVAVG